MKTLYLLPLDEKQVQFSFDKTVLEQNLLTFKSLPIQTILSVEVDDLLFENLKNSFMLQDVLQMNVPTHYYEGKRAFVENPPKWFNHEWFRIYVIFGHNKKCYWSPSGNNLNAIFENNPNTFLTQAIRVSLDKESYINLMAYFECACDNF